MAATMAVTAHAAAAETATAYAAGHPAAGDPAAPHPALLLFGLLALAAGLLVVVRRYLPALSKRLPLPIAALARRRLKVVEVMRFSPRSSVMMIEADGRRLLIGVCPNSVSLIADMGPMPPNPADAGHDA